MTKNVFLRMAENITYPKIAFIQTAKDFLTHRLTGRQMGRQPDRPADRQADRQIHRQTDHKMNGAI